MLTLTASPATAAMPPVGAWGNFPIFNDPALIAEADEYVAVVAAEAAAKKRRDILRKKFLLLMNGAPKAIVGHRVLQVTDVAGKPDSMITADMVGQVVKGRDATVQFRVA